MPTVRHLELLVAFDTPSDRRRRTLTRLLAPYGLRVQKSVFRINLTAAQWQVLWTALEHVCLPEEDALLATVIQAGTWREFGAMPKLEPPLVVSI